MKESFFDSLQSVDTTEKIPLKSEGLLVGIILPAAKTRIHKSPYSPQVAITIITEVLHDSQNSVLIVTGQADKAMVCQYFRCSQVKTVPLSFSAS